MEPNEWQKYKNKKSTEYTQKITSQARIAEEQLLEGLNESEVGYQHFGLVLAMKNGKIFVVPMSGNSSAYHRAYDPVSHMGKRHLMRLPEIEGLNKASVLFLNDAKWINSARVIDVKAHIDPNSHLFDKIKKCVMQMML